MLILQLLSRFFSLLTYFAYFANTCEAVFWGKNGGEARAGHGVGITGHESEGTAAGASASSVECARAGVLYGPNKPDILFILLDHTHILCMFKCVI